MVLLSVVPLKNMAMDSKAIIDMRVGVFWISRGKTANAFLKKLHDMRPTASKALLSVFIWIAMPTMAFRQAHQAGSHVSLS